MAKESVYIRKELNSDMIGLVHQHGKIKCLHKKTVELPQDWFGAPTWPPLDCSGTPIWLPYCHVKTFFVGISIFNKEVQEFYQLIELLQTCDTTDLSVMPTRFFAAHPWLHWIRKLSESVIILFNEPSSHGVLRAHFFVLNPLAPFTRQILT